MKTLKFIFVISVIILLAGTFVSVNAGSGQVRYSAVDGISTFSQKRILQVSAGWYAYNSSQAASQIEKIGLTIASAYWICPDGSIGYQVNSYNQYRLNSIGFDLNYAYLPNTYNTCGAVNEYAGGNHYYENNQLVDFVFAEHAE